jgi:anionic cell wall polymer biosynthesis LytR-Cps2A-Psr (LCP) family protein
VNVTERLPVGGSSERPVASRWLEPGRQKLDGYLALWYARSRWSTTDYDRMRRQRCVIADFVDQVDPVTVALRFPRIAETLKQNLQTSIPLQDLNAWVTLAERVKSSHLRSLAFTDQVINTARPDFDRMHALVRQALVAPANPPSSSASASRPGASGSPSASPSASRSATSARSTPTPPSAQDVSQVC